MNIFPPRIFLQQKAFRRGAIGLSLAFGTFSPGSTVRVPLLDGWEFHPDKSSTVSEEAAHETPWRTVTLPHDWSIEQSTDPDAATAGGGGFFPAGKGVYRNRFTVPETWREREITVLFEGVYRNATVFLNGTELATHAYGYTPFRVPLTASLHFDKANTLVVHVDNTPQPNSRWYTGSGIYRPVYLEARPTTHLVPESFFVTTREIHDGHAVVELSARLASPSSLGAVSQLRFQLGEAPNAVVAEVAAPEKGWKEGILYRAIVTVRNPQLWSPEDPSLHHATVELVDDDTVLDRATARIGIRTIRLSAQHGFLLNGEPVILFGGNVHHDHGPLGAAAYPEAERRKVRLLKEAGFNAVRTAHNPPSTAFLEACDAQGLIVIDESFDGWKSKKLKHDYGAIFEEHWEADLRAMVRRDRNHPSVVMWSIGNEVYERGSDAGIERAHAMAAIVRQLDRSRPVTIGLNGLGATGDWTRLDAIFDGLDVAGYNYELYRHAEDHKRRPRRLIYGSESYLTDAFANWKMSQENNYVIGDFVWTAQDYLGEAGIGRVFPPDETARAHWEGSHYPWHGAYCGDLDLIGSRKPISHYRNIVWDRGETLYAAVLQPTLDGRPWNVTAWSIPPALATWTWPGFEGRELTVEVYSRHPSVQLFLNDELIAEAPTGEAEAFKASFTVPYQPGTLVAKGGEETFTLTTAGPAEKLSFDAASLTAPANGHSLIFATVVICDADGVLHPFSDRPTRFEVEGPGRIVAVGSGNLATAETYRQNPRNSFQGRTMVVVEVMPGAKEGLLIRAQAEGLQSAVVPVHQPER